MNDTAEILKWIREVDRSTIPYDIVDIGWGPKISNGQETNVNGLIFLVNEKKPLSALSPNEIIPKNYTVENITLKTDVQEAVLHQKIVDCHNPSPLVEPIKSNYLKYRPLKGGCSSISFGGTDATLGIMVRDKTDGQVVALSNNHVYAASQVSAYWNVANEDGFNNTGPISARQPAGPTYNPYGNSTASVDYIGKCKRSVVIGNINPVLNGFGRISDTSCDAAILELSGYDLIDSVNSPNVVNFSQSGPYTFATDSEIDSLMDTGSPNYAAPIFRSGRTRGPVGYPGYSTFNCQLSVYQFLGANVGTYSGYSVFFSNCFYVRGTTVAGEGGDSGSAFFALFDPNSQSLSAWKMIGLLFAGPGSLAYSIGCRITSVTRDLDVVPWDTKMPTVTSNVEYIRSSSTSATLNISGRKYYQLGKV